MDHLVDKFLKYIEVEKNCSVQTLRNYAHYLSRFLDWSEKEKITSFDKISNDTISNYRQYLNRLEDKHGNKLSVKTQNYHVIALRALFKYLQRNDIETLAPEKITLSKQGDREITFLEPQEVERLFDVIDFAKKNGYRDRAILETLYSTGLRVSELVALNRDKINLERGEASIKGKGRKIRVVFFSDETIKWIDRYLKTRHDPCSALFIHREKSEEDPKDLRLTPRSIQRIIHYYANKAGITKKVTPHVLRHSFATDLLINGADLRSVQEMLGHKSVNTTQIYTHITNSQLRDVHGAFHGKQRQAEEEKD